MNFYQRKTSLYPFLPWKVSLNILCIVGPCHNLHSVEDMLQCVLLTSDLCKITFFKGRSPIQGLPPIEEVLKSSKSSLLTSVHSCWDQPVKLLIVHKFHTHPCEEVLSEVAVESGPLQNGYFSNLFVNFTWKHISPKVVPPKMVLW